MVPGKGQYRRKCFCSVGLAAKQASSATTNLKRAEPPGIYVRLPVQREQKTLWPPFMVFLVPT
jgi:hypothetical protein